MKNIYRIWLCCALALLLIPGLRAQQFADTSMVFVQGGTFQMGCTFEQGGDCNVDEKPVHEVTLKSFAIAKTEVTQRLWTQIMGNNPSRFKGDNLPVENVSYDDIMIFIQRLNQKTGLRYRLPTEAEWEYAARGGQLSRQTQYAGGANMESVAWIFSNSENSTHPVGTLAANELGLYDMSGNVWEWCNDLYGAYGSKAVNNPAGAENGNARVVRGGCFASIPQQCRVSSRRSYYGGGREYSIGFRLAIDDDREARAQAAREAAELAARQAAERAEQERIATEKAAAEAAKIAEQKRIAAEKKTEQERVAAEKKAEQERVAAEKKAEQERIAAEKAAAEAARIAEQERIAAEKKAEQERIATEKAAAEAAKIAEQERIAAEKKAEQERIATEKAAAEAAKIAEQERIAAEKKAEQERIAAVKDSAHTAKVETRRSRLDAIPSSTLFTFNGQIISNYEWAAGFKIGTMKNTGWYLSVLTNFNYKGMFNDFKDGQLYELNGNHKTSYLEALIGITSRRYSAVSFHFGLGCIALTSNQQATDGTWYRYRLNSYIGPAVATGLMFHIHSFVFSIEGVGMYNLSSYNRSEYLVGGNVGIGFCIPNKKDKQK